MEFSRGSANVTAQDAPDDRQDHERLRAVALEHECGCVDGVVQSDSSTSTPIPATASEEDVFAVREALESLVIMLAPFAPHVAEEMWEGLGHAGGL